MLYRAVAAIEFLRAMRLYVALRGEKLEGKKRGPM